MEPAEGKYIDVVGEGMFEEQVKNYIADLTIEVKASKSETAIKEADKLKAKCIQKLIKSGLEPDQIIDAGKEVWRPWWGSRKVAKEAYQKITVKTNDVDLLSKALSATESLFDNQRYVFTINMRQPEFEPAEGVKEEALKEAIKDARYKAVALASESGLTLTNVLQIQELKQAKRSSGAMGDWDWAGDSDRFAVAAAPMALADAGGAGAPDIESPKRAIWVKYRVRFGVE